MKLPTTSTIVRKDAKKVFQFLSDPKYLNNYPSTSGYKIKRIDHLNSLPFGLGKKLRINIVQRNKEIAADIEIYKYEPRKILGYRLINAYNKRKRKIGGNIESLLPEFKGDLILKEISNKTKLTYVTNVTNINSIFVKVIMYVSFGVFGYFRNKEYVRKLGLLIEKYV